MIFDLARDFRDALATIPRDHPKRRTLELFEEAIRRDIRFIDCHPTTLFQCMWNLCWWYDCPEAENHYNVPEKNPDTEQRHWNHSGQKLHALMELWHRRKEDLTPKFYWLRTLRPQKLHLGSSLRGILCGHESLSRVLSVAYSADGRLLASGSTDMTIRIWDAVTCAELNVLRSREEEEFESISFSPDGRRIVSRSTFGTVNVWDVAGGIPLFTKQHIFASSNVTFSPDGGRVVFGTDEGTVHILGAESGSEMRVLHHHNGEVKRVAFSPYGNSVASMGGSEIKLWDSRNGERSLILGRSCSDFGDIAKDISLEFTSDALRIVFVLGDGTVRFWDLGADTDIELFRFPKTDLPLALALGSHRGASTSGSMKALRLWDSDTGTELGLLCGHTDYVETAAFSPDGKQIASGSSNGVVILWDTQVLYTMDELNEHRSDIKSIAFSSEGDCVASGSRDNTMCLWNAQTGTLTRVVKAHESPVANVAFSPNGQRVVSCSRDGALVTDIASGETLTKLPSSSAEKLEFSPDGFRIITANNSAWQAWDSETGINLRTVRSEHGCGPFVYSPDALRILTASEDKTVLLYDLRTEREVLALRGHESQVNQVSFSPEGDRIVSCGDKTVRIWDIRTGMQTGVLRGHEDFVTSVAFSPNGQCVASASYDNTVRLWDVDSKNELRVFRGPNKYTDVAFSPDGKCIAVGLFDGSIQVWDVRSGARIYTLQANEWLVTHVAFSPDGNYIVSGDYNYVHLWDVQNKIELRTVCGNQGSSPAAFSPDGRRIASGAADNNIILWDRDTGVLLQTLRGHQYAIKYVAFSPDGKFIASSSYGGTIKIWDANSDRALNTLETGDPSPPNSVAFSPNSRIIAYDSPTHNIHVSDGYLLDDLAVLCGHTKWVHSIALSPDTRRIGSASRDGTVRIWDLDSGRELVVLRGHDSDVTSTAFSHSGNHVVSGSMDETARVWNLDTGMELMVLRGHRSHVLDVAFMIDDQRVISASHRRTGTGRWFDIHFWDAKSGECIRRIENVRDTTSVSHAAAGYRWLTFTQGYTTAVLCAESLLDCAWFPASLQHVTVSSARWTWAGSSAEHLLLFRLEGPKGHDGGEK
ncbi:MAG: hypothetical protein AMXMBFR84_35100 [Candidatus Hydrogenedentota bacterium]